MKKNIVFILFLLTISCDFSKETKKNSDNFSLSEGYCSQFYSYDAIKCLRKQVQGKSDSDSTLIFDYCTLANYYLKVNEKNKFSEAISVIDKLFLRYGSSEKIRKEYYKIKGLEKIESAKYYDAISFFKKAIALHNQLNDTSLLLINYKTGICYERMKNYDSSEFYYNRALYYKNLLKNINTDEVTMLFNVLAYNSYIINSDLYTAKKYYDSIEYISKKIQNPDSSNYAWNLYNMALFYQKIGNTSKAINCFSEALKTYSKYSTFSDDIAEIRISEIYAYNAFEKFELAHSKTDWNINYYTKNFKPSALIELYSEKAYIFFRERKNKEAIQYYKKALDFAKKYSFKYEEYMLNSIGWCYSNMNMLDSAEFFFKQCMKLEPLGDFYNFVTLYGEYSRLLIKREKYQEAIRMIDTKLPFIIKKFGKKNIQYGYFIYWKALACEKLGKYESSLKIYQEVIDISINGKNNDIYSLPVFEISEIIEHDNLIDALTGKASVLGKMASITTKSDKKINLFQKSLAHYEKAYDVVTKVNKQIESENDRLQFTGKKAAITEKILLNAYELYKLTNKPEYLEKAFFIADMGKATQVVLGLKDDEYKHLSGIPEEMIRKEKDLQEEISLIQSTLSEEKYKHNVDTTKVDNLNSKLYNTVLQYEKLSQKMSSDYPYYNQIKFTDNRLKIDSLKKLLSQDKVLISYTITGDSLFSFLLTNKRLKIKVEKFKNLNDSILYFRKQITEINDISFTYEGILNYIPSAYCLYKTLLKPFEEDIEGKNLILIPDGLLNLIPFEALLTSDSLPLKTDYAVLPYLINKHSISYAYSAELFALRNKMKTVPTNQVLAYAPEYNNTIIELPSSIKGNTENIQLGQLRGSEEEVSQISRTFGGKAIEGKKATKFHFKSNAGNNTIIHLAMHTIIDNENPLYSKLVFTPGKYHSENAFLNTYEIYNLKMHAPLVVLSACNTGYGKIMKGEGIISLARGFIYSGCPSLVITLWSIADRSSSNLMQSFYKNLKLNNDVDVALQKAKVEYINNSDQRLSHPYFWAGYIQTGKTVPVYEHVINYKKLITGAIIIFILSNIVFLIIRRRHNQ